MLEVPLSQNMDEIDGPLPQNSVGNASQSSGVTGLVGRLVTLCPPAVCIGELQKRTTKGRRLPSGSLMVDMLEKTC